MPTFMRVIHTSLYLRWNNGLASCTAKFAEKAIDYDSEGLAFDYFVPLAYNNVEVV